MPVTRSLCLPRHSSSAAVASSSCLLNIYGKFQGHKPNLSKWSSVPPSAPTPSCSSSSWVKASPSPQCSHQALEVPYSALTIANYLPSPSGPLPRMLLDLLTVPSPPCCLQSETKSCQLYPESPDVSLSLVVYTL